MKHPIDKIKQAALDIELAYKTYISKQKELNTLLKNSVKHGTDFSIDYQTGDGIVIVFERKYDESVHNIPIVDIISEMESTYNKINLKDCI